MPFQEHRIAVLVAFLLWLKTITKSKLGNKGFILSYSLQSIMKGSQGTTQSRNQEVRIKVEATEEHYLLACFLLYARADFLCNPAPLAQK